MESRTVPAFPPVITAKYQIIKELGQGAYGVVW